METGRRVGGLFKGLKHADLCVSILPLAQLAASRLHSIDS